MNWLSGGFYGISISCVELLTVTGFCHVIPFENGVKSMKFTKNTAAVDLNGDLNARDVLEPTSVTAAEPPQQIPNLLSLIF